MSRISSGPPKAGAPAHPNKFAFRHNPSSRLTLHITSLPISGLLCPSCVAVIEWKKRFRKYKPLTVAKRCTACTEKGSVKEAYHVVCHRCAVEKGKCAKCLDARSLDPAKITNLASTADASDMDAARECADDLYASGSDEADDDQ